MACNLCGNTNSNPCACQDHALTTPCSYTDCVSVPDQSPYVNRVAHPEHCSEVNCTDCIAYCKSSYQIGGSPNWLTVNKGDKLDTVIQRMMIYMTTPTCYAIAIPHIWHDPAYTTGTAIKINWDSVPAAVTTVDVQYATINSTTWTTDNTTTINPTTAISWTIGSSTPLMPNTAYKIRLRSTDNSNVCYSVELLVTTGNN